jgi:hypothetical protein
VRPYGYVLLAACGASSPAKPDGPVDGAVDAIADAAIDGPAGFGDLSGMCGVLAAADLTGPTPELFRVTMTFARGYVDPDDRPLLTPGGQVLAATPNAGGSSGLSEIFAFEQLARCEHASLLKTETQIVYSTTGKITDMEVQIGADKIGVSVTRAQTYPLGMPYTLDAATMLITRKLDDIQTSSADVSAGDRWTKQILAILAWDSQAADTMTQAWNMLGADVKADTLVVITATDGDDTFIYTNM